MPPKVFFFFNRKIQIIKYRRNVGIRNPILPALIEVAMVINDGK